MGKKFQVVLPDGMEEYLETIASVIISKALITNLSSGIPGEES